jgi:hypothetical protein
MVLIMVKLLNFLFSLLFFAFLGFMLFLLGETIYYLVNLNWVYVAITLFKLFTICILFCLVFINYFVSAIEHYTGKKNHFK